MHLPADLDSFLYKAACAVMGICAFTGFVLWNISHLIHQFKSCISSPFLRYTAGMGLDVGGYSERPDWPKMGPSLLIATCLIVAIRTAKWPAISMKGTSDSDVQSEIDFAEHIASRVLARLMKHHEAIFPQRKEPWYQPDGKDQPK